MSSIEPEIYTIYQMPLAQAEARGKHLPLVWVYASRKDYTQSTSPDVGSDQELTLMTFSYLGKLRQSAVIIAIVGKGGLNQVPDGLKAQFEIPDDGPQTPVDNVPTPKIVITDSDGAVTLARISNTELQALHETVIYNTMYSILHNSQYAGLLQAPALPSGLTAGSASSVPVVMVPAGNANPPIPSLEDSLMTSLVSVLKIFGLLLVILGGFLFAMRQFILRNYPVRSSASRTR